MMSPRLTPMRRSIRRSARTSKLRSAALLNGDGAFDGAHGTRELRHDAIACDVYDSAAVLGDEREDDRLVRFEIAHRLFFVAPHRAGVADAARGQDGREATLVGM